MENAVIARFSGGGASSLSSATAIWEGIQGDAAEKRASCLRFGFTLAEVLITLGIIGVVSAMTLPTVVNNTQNKQLETALKKAYSILGQVVQRVVLEDLGGVVDAANGKELSPYFVKYYKQGNLCNGSDTGNGCPNSGIGTGNFCTFMQKNYKTYNGKSNPACVGNDVISNTVDNTTIFFDAPNLAGSEGSATVGKILMAIDVNGWQKKPNRWGHDIFMFQITKNGKLLPMGAEGMSWPEEDYCSGTSSSVNNGYGCTVRALSDKDYFKNLPK